MSGNSDPLARAKIDRLLAMIDELRRRPWSVDELAQEFRVSRRTIFRDLVDLERHYPLERKDGLYRLPRRLVFPGGCCRLCGQPMTHGEAQSRPGKNPVRTRQRSVTTRVAQPYFVTPHAFRRYQERVDPTAGWQDAITAVLHGLQDAAPYPPDRTIAIGNKGGGRFVAIVEPPKPGHEWPQVVTIWSWKICPILLKKKGRCGTRRYRWLNRPMTSVA